MNNRWLSSKRAWIQGLLSVALGLTLSAYLLGLTVADPPLEWFVLLVLISTFPFIAIITGNLNRFLIALIVLDVSLSLDIQLFDQLSQASVVTIYVSLTTLSLVIAYSLWTARLLVGRAKIDMCKSISLPALFFIATGILSVHNAKEPILSVLELVLITELFLMYFYLANHLQSLDDFRFISRILLIGLLIVGISVLVVYFFGGFRFMGFGGETFVMEPERFFRSGGLLGHPNTAATYLVPILMIALAVFLTAVDGAFGKLLAMVTFPLGVVALILTFSRGGWVNFAVAGLVFTFLALRRKWIRLQYVVLLIVITGSLTLMFRDSIFHRLISSDYGSALSRVPLNIIAINMIKSNLWSGVGINNFMVVVKNYLTPETYGAWLAPVHNKYLLVWSETGAIGIFAFIVFYLSIAKESWHCYKSNHPIFSIVGAALLASLSGYAAHMIVDRFGDRSTLQLLWLMAAMAIGLRRLSDKSGSV